MANAVKKAAKTLKQINKRMGKIQDQLASANQGFVKLSEQLAKLTSEKPQPKGKTKAAKAA